MPNLEKRFQSLRQTHGLSQRALAIRSGISNALISLIEKDKISPSVSSLKKILDSFPIDLADLFAMPSGAFAEPVHADRIDEGTSA